MLESILENARPEINHLGISGGKDSTALLLWALHESSYQRDTIRATFCDTGNEHPFAYAYIRYLSETVFPIEWLTPDLDFYRLARKKKRFPSARARFCTTELKIRPTREYVHELLRQGYSVRMHTGVRAAESRARAALAERDYDPDFLAEIYRPLLKWTLQQVLEIHARHGVPTNPLYGLTETLPWNQEPNPFYGEGVSRVGCYPCILSRKEEIAGIARRDPEHIAWLLEQEHSVENRCGYSSLFARNKVPLCHRSREIVTKAGIAMKVATIEDVARWSQTSHGGVQYRLNLELKEEMEEEVPSCASNSGLCE